MASVYESHEEMYKLCEEIEKKFSRSKKWLSESRWEYEVAEETKEKVISHLGDFKKLLEHCEEICNNKEEIHWGDRKVWPDIAGCVVS